MLAAFLRAACCTGYNLNRIRAGMQFIAGNSGRLAAVPDRLL